MVDKIDVLSVHASSKSFDSSNFDKADEAAFRRFSDLGISARVVVFVGGILLIISSYMLGMSLIQPKSYVFLSVVAGLGLIVRNLFAIFMIYHFVKLHNSHNLLRRHEIAPWFTFGTTFICLFSSFVVGLHLLARVLNGKCDKTDQYHVWSCNPEHDSRALPQDMVMILMMLPFVYALAFKAKRVTFIAAWIMSVVFLAVAIIVGEAVTSVTVLVIYVSFSLVILNEVHRQNAALFVKMKKQRVLLSASKQISEESQNELRFMIANMAHDLKTVCISDFVIIVVIYCLI